MFIFNCSRLGEDKFFRTHSNLQFSFRNYKWYRLHGCRKNILNKENNFDPLFVNFVKRTKNDMKDLVSFDEHLAQRYGKIGTEKRTKFDIKAKAFAIGEILREARKEAHMTQEELARKTGTRKSFISRIENGHSDIQLSTLYRLVEIGTSK
jgi:DNA-binding XRE family transcriptional regulator